uniref:Uncharacterized protein n=1 Tax=Rhizophora mucronata TaxID=61149 RepID=A0A2P2MHS1_RHIMU
MIQHQIRAQNTLIEQNIGIVMEGYHFKSNFMDIKHRNKE